MSENSVRVRIAPSPTGDPHVGTAYMALFNLIFARHHNGKFILRIEDTDQTRSRPEYEKNIYDSLKWCKLSWDEGPDCGGPYGPYRQSERTEIYQKYAYELLETGGAYKCFCTQEDLQEMREVLKAQGGKLGYDRRCRNLSPDEIKANEDLGKPFVIRLKVPLTGDCVYQDAIKGRISNPWADVDDQVLLKSDGFPTYHLANVVDDHLMKITHVIRGDEWMSSTPKHILLYEHFGWKAPEFMHMPLLLGIDGKKLSKRKNPTSIFFYRDSGFLPEAFMNFLTLMGYSMPGDREIYSLDEIIKEFDKNRIGVSGAVFDISKLEWLNQQYLIKNIPEEDLWKRIQEWSFNETFMKKLMPLIHTRIKTFSEFMELCDFFFVSHLKLSPDLFTIREGNSELSAALLQAMIWKLDELENWGSAGVNQASHFLAEKFQVHHKKSMMKLLYGAVMGKPQGPPLFDSSEILGKDRLRARLLKAIEFLGGISNKKMALLKKCWDQNNLEPFLSDVKSAK
ncbi:glutamate--tRNA ligase [Criblamydia sequanensis]|uniref:Glutamate--tRNA ligase n=1 Tax=Candidatus Criblamydia sequanensis CRIB-18 TaxID=1437425 RepID=A0A090E259_9BACT|nr:glutamate--tRNA ligase [Criblamydia sequanensis]CDR34754.1 Glutamyl-tRNA synthetase [Criblamydia sequanensis CRIB-18]